MMMVMLVVWEFGRESECVFTFRAAFCVEIIIRGVPSLLPAKIIMGIYQRCKRTAAVGEVGATSLNQLLQIE